MSALPAYPVKNDESYLLRKTMEGNTNARLVCDEDGRARKFVTYMYFILMGCHMTATNDDEPCIHL